jgi:ABC-2 type transport system permease protein
MSEVAGQAPQAGAGPAERAAQWPAPAPGAAPRAKMIMAQAWLEARMLVRNGEQLVLTLVIPVLLLVAFSLDHHLVSGETRKPVDFLVPGMIALAVLSTAFTSQAIATGFERRYGVLKRLGSTPLSRSGLIGAKTTTVIGVELAQTVILLAVGLALGWRTPAGPAAVAWVALLVLAGTAAFSGLALLLAGTLRAEATLALANLVYLVLLGIGGIIFPLTKFPASARPVLTLLPSGALSDGLHKVLQYSGGLPLRDLAVLAVWAVITITLAARLFKWE